MASTVQDYQLSALAAGFSLGFGVLTIWEAIKQTRRNRSPLRSVYIYMIWGELVANFGIGIIAWLFLEGKLGPTVPVLFFILFFWVLQIHFLMQIIINRIFIIAERQKTIVLLKWTTAAVITLINISVFCIWIPSHIATPVPIIFKINNIWDKIEKVLILSVDGFLNWYFLHIVNLRLIKQHRLNKYKPLIGFNTKLMILSVAMDGMLIGVMFLRNPIVYLQFHPVCYLVKLNIEMSMASLITHVARGTEQNDMYPEEDFHGSNTDPTSNSKSHPSRFDMHSATHQTNIERGQGESFHLTSMKGGQKTDSRNNIESATGIHCRTDLNIVVEHVDVDSASDNSIIEEKRSGSSRSSTEGIHSCFGDETPLRKNGIVVTEKAD